MSAQPAGVFRTVSSTVHEATYEVLRSLGVTPIFGNPGSNELPFINQLPSGFRYILALHEGAGLAIADGYSQSHGHAYTSGCMQID